MNFGLQKSWKRRPAINHKTMLLEYLSKPTATPKAARKLLQTRVGLEVSACTSNAQRITLEEVLKLAFPSDLEKVETACIVGDPLRLSMFLADLEATGLNHENRMMLFWPLSNGIGEVLKLSQQPQWLELLKDTPQSSCFAVLSLRCLTFSGRDSERYLRRLCLRDLETACAPVLHTTIELNPESFIQPPLTSKTILKLANGKLIVRNEAVPAQLAFYEPDSSVQRLGWRKSPTHRELIGVSHMSPYLVQVCMVDQP